MEITFLGRSAFKIQGKEITIVTDPFDPAKSSVGKPFPKVEADVITVSHDHGDHNNVDGVKGNAICFNSPGEYEIKNTEIIGINSSHGGEHGDNTIFVFQIDGIHVCHLGDLGVDLTAEQLEKIDGVDVLMIPVGGAGYTLDPKSASKAISEIGPKVVIPMHYQDGKKELEPVENFLKEIGKEAKNQDKLKLVKKDLPEEMEVIVLK